jgi:hypothetical protein
VAAVGIGVGAVAVMGARHAPTVHRGIKTRHRNARASVHLSTVRSQTRAEWGPKRPLNTPKSVTGSRTRALTMGPKGKATVRQRRYRARQRAAA